MDELAGLRERMRGALDDMEIGEERLAGLEAEAQLAEETYAKAASKLSDRRVKAAKALDKAVMAELAPLKLERASFQTRVESDTGSGGPDGRDRVEFWVQTNPGTHPGPLLKVASGGELSRFLLALKVALADKGSARRWCSTKSIPLSVARCRMRSGVRLQRLSDRVQVLTVTHAPQVAARATRQLLIRKEPRAHQERRADAGGGA